MENKIIRFLYWIMSKAFWFIVGWFAGIATTHAVIASSSDATEAILKILGHDDMLNHNR